jgi:hypothetical protein
MPIFSLLSITMHSAVLLLPSTLTAPHEVSEYATLELISQPHDGEGWGRTTRSALASTACTTTTTHIINVQYAGGAPRAM